MNGKFIFSKTGFLKNQFFFVVNKKINAYRDINF